MREGTDEPAKKNEDGDHSRWDRQKCRLMKRFFGGGGKTDGGKTMSRRRKSGKPGHSMTHRGTLCGRRERWYEILLQFESGAGGE